MRKILFMMIFGLVSCVFSQNLVLNEIMASNQTTLYDEDDDASDWIELYNQGTEAIDLSGYCLSDDTTETDKWIFGNVSIQPGAYLIVFASDKDRTGTNCHTNFKISASGESIVLSDTSGSVIDRVDLPELETDISYGRKSDGGFPWTIQDPTPGASNSGSVTEKYADAITVSQSGGFYSSAVDVVLSAGDSKIYYTLDGSDPDDKSTEYSTPIHITTTKVLRAVSMKDGFFPGPEICQTYLIDEDTDLPVISLTSDPYNLFDADYGLYTNYTEDWERPAHVEFFEDDRSPGFSENCGIEIYGGQSATAPQKSIAVKFKKQYGVLSIEYPLFPDFRVTTFKAFVLRNSGNDMQYTHIRDAVMQNLVKDLNIDYQEYRPATSFINGEYWGIYNIREKINEHYIANRHGVDADNIDLLENNMKVIQGDALSYQQLIDYMNTNDMTTDSAYAYLDSVIDLNECILYFAAQAYYDNMDWPGTNIKFWRERSPSGKWRWILFGLDFGFGLYAHGPSEDHITFMFSPIETRYSNPPWATLLQRKLIENPAIQNRFINQIADLLNTNFRSDRVVEVIDSLADHISDEIARHRTKWGISGESTEKMITFAQQRPAYLRTHVRNYFNCGNNGTLAINAAAGGSVNLNTLKLQSTDMPFSGIYFQGNAIQLKAVPKAGYVFSGWSGSMTSEEDSISIRVSDATELTANFVYMGGDTPKIVINEINYHASDLLDAGDWVEFYNYSGSAVDMSNWTFSDSDTSHAFIFPAGTVLDVDQYLVLIQDDSAFAACYPEVTHYLGEMNFSLSNGGELIALRNPAGMIVDSLTFDDSIPWPIEADGKGSTLELIDPASDNAAAESWLASLGHGTPGSKNSASTGVKNPNASAMPEHLALYQNYPNPFNARTLIRYQIPGEARVELAIFNASGQLIETLVNTVQSAGYHTAEWDASHVSSGIYFYRLTCSGSVLMNKLLIIK